MLAVAGCAPMLFVRILCVCVGGCLDGWVSRGDEVGGGPEGRLHSSPSSKCRRRMQRDGDALISWTCVQKRPGLFLCGQVVVDSVSYGVAWEDDQRSRRRGGRKAAPHSLEAIVTEDHRHPVLLTVFCACQCVLCMPVRTRELIMARDCPSSIKAQAEAQARQGVEDREVFH
jgi:hypothetical protein